MAKILVIDDEPLVRKTINMALSRAGHMVIEAADGLSGTQEYARRPFDLIITDILMPEQEGIETVRRLRMMNANLKILAISGGGRSGSTEFLALAQRFGASATLAKPFEPDQLLRVVNQLLG